MRQSEAFLRLEAPKGAFASSVAQALFKVAGVESVTFTGSFVEKPGLIGISDIDVVVVVGTLTEGVFTACRAAVADVSPSVLGLSSHRVLINDSFGPLKFDQPGVIVVHLMIYDRAGHRDHVLKSPFTCLDWERSPYFFGPSLRSIFPVLALQPRQFREARRSLTNYILDIASGTLSYRRYAFESGHTREVLNRLPLDARHQGEFGYHIVRNLVANYAKLIRRENVQLSEAELIDFWRQQLPACNRFIDWFTSVAAIKQARGHDFPEGTLAQTREFLAAFSDEIHETWARRATRHLFVRHGRTALNDGTFLGQHRDPPIIDSPPPLEELPARVLTSPAHRCRMTAACLAPEMAVVADPGLSEINYGAAEGLSFAQLATRYPDLIAAWDRLEDPRFPDGENTADVAKRLETVISTLDHRPTLVVTHNVVLRCLLGSGLQLPPSTWHRIPVSHLEPFPVLLLDGQAYLDLSTAQVARITDAVTGFAP